MTTKKVTYTEDFYSWTVLQANLLKEKRFDELDFTNLIDEVETLGRGVQSEIFDCLALLLAELLKWQYQTIKPDSSDKSSIDLERKNLNYLLQENPSLVDYATEELEFAYEISILKALQTIDVAQSVLPQKCPYTLEQITDQTFYPNQ